MEYKLFAQRIGLIGITNLLLSLSGIILLPILTKNLSIEEYGLWIQIGVTISIVPNITLLGLPFTMVRFLPSAREKRETQEIFYSIFFLAFFTSILGALFIYILAPVLATILFDRNIIIVKLTSYITLVQCINSILFNYFRATQQITKYSILQIIYTCFNLYFISILILQNKGIIGATYGLLISSAIISIITISIIILDIGIIIPKFKNIKEYLNFGLPTIPGNLSNWIANVSDRYIINIYMGTASVGYYSPGYSLGSMITVFSEPLNFLLPAMLSQYYDEGKINEVKRILSYSLKYYLTIAIPSFIGLSFLSKSILTILSTPEIALNGYLITPIVTLSMLLMGIYNIYQKIIILEKKTKITASIWTISGTLNLILNILIIPKIGIIGAAVTTLFSFALCLIIIIYYSSKFLSLEIHINHVLKCVVASIPIPVIILMECSDNLYDIIFTIITCIIVYFIIMTILKGIEKKDIDFFKEVLKK